MATNTVIINFDPCEPAPASGYRVRYRKVGGGAYTYYPGNFLTSPAELIIDGDPFGQDYEGYIMGNCGGGKYGVQIPWTAVNNDSLSESPAPSVSASESASASEPPVEGGEFRAWANMTSTVIIGISGITNDIAYPVTEELRVGAWTVYPGGNIIVDLTDTLDQAGDVVLSVNGVVRDILPLVGDGAYVHLAANVGVINPGDVVQVRVRP